MRTIQSIPAAATLLAAAVILTGCQSLGGIGSEPVTGPRSTEIREAAVRFTRAVREEDATAVRQLTLVSHENSSRQIEDAVLKDAITGHAVDSTLRKQFGYHEENPGVVGSNAWVDRFTQVAETAPIARAGNRVRIGEAGEDGSLYLREVNGSWKVELIPTLVAEAGGRPVISNSAVLYRFGVNEAMNQWLLARLDNKEFASIGDFDQAHDVIWIKYLGVTLSGKDPHDELLSSLPPLPKDAFVADER